MLNSITGEVGRAGLDDIEAIQELIRPYVQKKVLLPRSEEQIKKDLALTWVARQNNDLVGCMNLTYFEPDLYEVRGLAVAESVHGQRVGSRLLAASLEHLVSLNRKLTVFALTYVPAFFESHGFTVVSKEKFPAKIYEVCQYCGKRNDCSEIAVEYSLDA